MMRHAAAALSTLLACLVLTACVSAGSPPGRFADLYPSAVVAADHVLASRAGLEMLDRGGNAVDAAVATSFCLAVVRPYSCGLGGGGFMVIHLAADEPMPPRNIAITYREAAPSGVGPDYYVRLDEPFASRIGPTAAGVPGSVAGLFAALENYGSLDRTTVIAPAIRAASEGFAIDADYVNNAQEVLDDLAEHPEWIDLIGRDRYEWLYHRFLFDGHPKVGDTLRQPELARTLELLARDGAPAFYAGEIAEAIADACPQMEVNDLSHYTAEIGRPLRGAFQGRTILAMPLPSSGGIAMLEALGIIERRWNDLPAPSLTSPPYIHLVVEALKHAFADRAQWLADSRFTPVPVQRLLSVEYLADLAGRVDLEHTQTPERYGSRAPLPDDHGTSHLSVVDRWGNAVACTETINLGFGSLTALPEFGVLLNDEMDDFLTIPGERNAFGLQQSERNLPEPGKWPLSSMSPTIVLGKDGQVEMVLGASGGPRIITACVQVLLDVLMFDLPARQAAALPRFHHQWMPDVLEFEDAWSDQAMIEAMKQYGHDVRRCEGVGVVQVIRRAPGGDGWQAASDPRKGGEPAGR